ncbi:MAG: hypothetical protein V8T45_04370 [Oscillospiraceae bacterium]
MAKSDYKGIWVFAEQQNGKLNGTVLELLAKSQELKEHTGEEISAVLLGKNVSIWPTHSSPTAPTRSSLWKTTLWRATAPAPMRRL